MSTTNSTTRTSPATRIARAAHSESVQLNIRDIIAELNNVLGRAVVAFMVNKDARTVQRWAAGDNAPQIGDDRKLRDVFQVYKVVSEVEGTPTVRAWFMGMNPQLDDVSPAEALQAGQVREAMMAARAFVQGG